MDMFLFPSRYEGFGVAMIEAQASGLACVASDVVPEDTNVSGKTVYCSLASDDGKWAELVLSTPERTIAPEVVRCWLHSYSSDTVFKEMERFYCGGQMLK